MTTTITVVDGVVVSREYTGEEVGGSCPAGWLEQEDSLGSHTGSGLALPLTLDEIYQRCADEVVDMPYPWDEQPDHEVVAFDALGVLSRCGWYRWNSTHDRSESSPYFEIERPSWL